MRLRGNTIVNQKYNPRGIKAQIPLDADEVDSVMERFIRQKYQEMSLVDGRPKPPSRSPDGRAVPAEYRRTSAEQSPPPLKPKKNKLFSFGLRSTSSAYPMSKHEKKVMPPIEPTMENAFRVASPPLVSKQSRVFGANVGEDPHFDAKLTTLRDMGFPDDNRNATMLKSLSGNLERTIESLVRLGEGSQPPSRSRTPRSSIRNTPTSSTFPEGVKGLPATDIKSPTLKPPAFNPFDSAGSQQAGAQQASSHNPFGIPPDPQILEQSLNNLHLSQQHQPQTLFPHSTGGYPSQSPMIQQNRMQQSMTPPVPSHNPFFQSSTQINGNPYASMMQPVQPMQMSIQTNTHNPFVASGYSSSPVTQTPQSVENYGQPGQASSNPFQSQFSNQMAYSTNQQIQQGYQPVQSVQAHAQTYPAPQTQQASNPFGGSFGSSNGPGASDFFATMNQNALQFQTQDQSAQQQQQQIQSQQFPTTFPQQQVQQQPQQLQQQQQAQHNPFMAQQQQNPFAPPQQPTANVPQQTGRYDKASILALYNYSSLAPPALPTIMDEPSPSNEVQQPFLTQQQNPVSQQSAPLQPSAVNNSPRRSVTMPVNSLGPSAGSRNPFLGGSVGAPNSANMNGSQLGNNPMSQVGSAPPSAFKGIASHSSRESTDLAALQSGRHSPDAFAMLSARYGR